MTENLQQKKLEDIEDVLLMSLEVIGGLVSLLECNSLGKHIFNGTLPELRITSFFLDTECTLPMLRNRMNQIARYTKSVPLRQKKFRKEIIDIDRK